jgi:hypothetical protein
VWHHAEMPSAASPRAAATTSAGVRVRSSVPSTPTTVVTPARVNRESGTGGTRVWGPASPPPPVMWAWPSISPGTSVRPRRSTSSTASAGRERGEFAGGTHPQHAFRAHQDVAGAERLGSEDVRVAEQGEHGGQGSSLAPGRRRGRRAGALKNGAGLGLRGA